MKRVRLNENGVHHFKKGNDGNGGGRPRGSRNKLTLHIKTAVMLGAALAGSRLEEDGDEVTYFAWLARKHPEVYGRIVERIVPFIVTAKVDETHTHKYETVGDVLNAFKQRGLPPPPDMIDITPEREKDAA
jgi:hypothetical protein